MWIQGQQGKDANLLIQSFAGSLNAVNTVTESLRLISGIPNSAYLHYTVCQHLKKIPLFVHNISNTPNIFKDISVELKGFSFVTPGSVHLC